MDEERSVPKKPEVFASDTKQALSGNGSSDDVKIARSLLETLPFTCEKERDAFLKRVQCLQDYHIIQIFKFGVAFFKKNLDDSSALLDDGEVKKLFEICFSFCYVTDLSKRVAFDYYARILKFCFSSQSKQCLRATNVSQILHLVQDFQEGRIGFSDDYRKEINRTKDFFEELFTIFNKRRDGDFIAEIISQTMRFASADVGNANQGQSLGSDIVKSHVPFTNWIRLLKVDSVSNRFASVLVKTKALQWKDQQRLPGIFVLGDSGGHDFVSIVDKLKIDGKEVTFPSDEKRLDIYVGRLNHFLEHRSLLVTSLKVLVCTSIANEVFEEVLDHFCCERERLHPHQQNSDSESKADAFSKVYDVLVSLPDGKLVCDVLRFWRRTFSGDKEYQSLKGLMHLFPEVSPGEDSFFLEERVERVLNYLEWLPPSVQSLISVWYHVLSAMIALFPATFDRLPEVLVMIQWTLSDTGALSQKRENFRPSIFFFRYCSIIDVTEEKRKEMILLFICTLEIGCSISDHDWRIPMHVIQQLSLCENIPFSIKKRIIRKLTTRANLFDLDLTNRIITNIFKNISLDPSFRIQIYRAMVEVIESGVGKGVFWCGVLSLEPVRVLFQLATTVPISGDRRVKILLKAKESDNSLLNSIQILEMTKVQCPSDEVNKFFDLFYTAYVDIMKEEGHFCGRFYKQQCHQYSYSPIQHREILILEVAKLISAGSFNEELYFWCCLPVLVSAGKVESAGEMLQLFSQVRESAVKLFNKQQDNQILERFARALCIVVSSDSLSSEEKLKLVKEVCETSLTYPSMLFNGALRRVLSTLIPPSDVPNTCLYTMKVPMLLELSEIIAVLKNPTLIYQVAKCPFHILKALSSVFFKASSSEPVTGKLESICQFIGEVENIAVGFLERCLPVLETAVEISNSVEDVMELLKEFVFMIQAASPDVNFVPLFSEVYSHLLRNETKKEGRKQFTNDVLQWTASNVMACRYLKVLQLLCKVYNFSESPEKRCEILHRLQEILRKTKNFKSLYEDSLDPEGYIYIKNKVACCDLEWLVFHSSLSTEEAALAFNLCTQCFQGRLKCYSFWDVEIVNGCFKFVPREQEPCTDESTVGMEYETLETNTIVFTPALIVEKIIHHLKRVIEEDGHLAENALYLWRLVCRESSTCECLISEFNSETPFHDSYIEVFLSILSQASSKEIMLYWAQLDSHHLCQCSEVILTALKLSDNASGETDKNTLIEFQPLVYKTMETMRGQIYSGGNRCFLHPLTQLESLRGLLDCGPPIKIISLILTLFQINERAAFAARDIVSEWSHEQQAIELIEALKMRCEGKKMSSLPAQHAIFVWELLKSFRRLFKNSCENVLKWLEELVVLFSLGFSHCLGRLSGWRYQMLEHGVPAIAVDCWCVAFLTTPLEELTSHDVDIIVGLDSSSLELVPSVSQKIKPCLFPENGFEIAQKEKKGIKEPQIKERLRLARLLRELINILRVQKLDELSNGRAIRKMVVDTCDELCEAYVSQENEEKKGRRENNLYKIRELKLKVLFTEIFCNQSRVNDEEPGYTGVTHQPDCKETGALVPCTRTESHENERLPSVLRYREIYEPLLVLMRRWLSGILNKEILSSYVHEIVCCLVSKHSNNDSIQSTKQLHDALRHHIMENNQALVAQLKADGYGPSEKGSQDLWSSPAIECSGYLHKSELGHEKKNKKLVEVLRNVWNEWKDILIMQKIGSIKVGDKEIAAGALFGYQLSLEEMEAQVSVVKKRLSQLKSEDLQRKVTELIRKEERHRSRIEEMYKDEKVRIDSWKISAVLLQ